MVAMLLLSCTELAWLACDARAEPSAQHYDSGKAVTSPAERENIARQLEVQRLRAAQDAARRAADEQARLRREAEAWARLPPGERLVRERCASCHTLAVMDGIGRGNIGWRLTVERMRWWHGAQLGPGESTLVAEHLRTARPTDSFGAWSEFAMLAALALFLLALPAAVYGALKRKGKFS